MRKKTLLGHVGVDSGHLMICDPCYLRSWDPEGTEDNTPYYLEKATGKRYAFAPHATKNKNEKTILFTNTFDNPLPDGRIPNNLIASGEWVENRSVSNDGMHEFSGNGAFNATCTEKRGGPIRYAMGHEGQGVSFQSGQGDGCYPVYAEYDRKGIIVKITIDLK